MTQKATYPVDTDHVIECGCTGTHHTERCGDPKLRRRWRLVVGTEQREPRIQVDVDSLPRAYALRVLYLRAHPWGQVVRIGGDPR